MAEVGSWSSMSSNDEIVLHVHSTVMLEIWSTPDLRTIVLLFMLQSGTDVSCMQ